MRWHRSLALGALLLLAVALAAGNVWSAAVRSTIPLALEAVVAGKEVRHEKHPPRDDVWLLDLAQQGLLQVDQGVFDRVDIGDRLSKERWSWSLNCGGRRFELEWSADARGMCWAMPLTVAIFMAMAAWVIQSK